MMKQRKGGFRILGSHNLKMKETEELSRAGAEEIVIGTGINPRAGLSNDVKSYAEQAQLELHTLPSYEAVRKFNHLIDLGKKVAAIIHITC